MTKDGDIPNSLLALSVKVSYLNVVKRPWLKWVLLGTSIFVLIGLVSVVLLDRWLMSPFGVGGLDVVFYLAILFLGVVLILAVFILLWFPVFLIAAVLAALAGCGLFVFQAYVFLRYGEWQSFSLRRLLEIIGFDMVGLDYPRDWVGLTRLLKIALEWIPSALFLVIGGGWFAGHLLAEYEESVENLRKEYKKLSDA